MLCPPLRLGHSKTSLVISTPQAVVPGGGKRSIYTMGGTPRHIVMFPFMAQGHLIPFLALAKLIHRRHPGRYSISFVSTPLNINSLRSSVPPEYSSIHLTALPFSAADHGLPPDGENTDSLHYDDMDRLHQASETLQPHFEHLLSDITQREGRPPVCVLADMLIGWTVAAASKLGIFHATFTTGGAFGTAAYVAMWLHLPHLRTDADDFPVPGLPESFRLHRSQLAPNIRDTDGKDAWAVSIRKSISLCLASRAMLCNTVEEVETRGMELLRKVAGFPVWAVGPVLPKDGRSSDSRTGKKADIDSKTCIEWLDRHASVSVLYVCFGSQNTVGETQMLQLAAGLEASGHPFIWVVRPPLGFDPTGDFREEWLPVGFEGRMRENGRGLLVKNWAPQLEILTHGSTAAYLSHCGWNSVLESLGGGVPLIGWPMGAEQFYNSKMLEEELGVSVELARGDVAEVTAQEVERVIREVVGGERGGEMRRRAARCKELIEAAVCEEKGCSIGALDNFLDTISRVTAGEDS